MRGRLLILAALDVALIFLLGAPVNAQQAVTAGLPNLSFVLGPAKSKGMQPRSAYQERSLSLFGKLGRYVKTHKELLLMDSLVVLPVSAEAASTVHCLHVSPFCNESNELLGRRPSTGAVWGLALGYSAGIITANHLAWRALNDPETWPRWRHLPFAWDTFAAVKSSLAVKHNVDFAEKLQSEARKRIMRKD
jgi:hypothetical protein